MREELNEQQEKRIEELIDEKEILENRITLRNKQLLNKQREIEELKKVGRKRKKKGFNQSNLIKLKGDSNVFHRK